MSEKALSGSAPGSSYTDLNETMARSLLQMALSEGSPIEDLLHELSGPRGGDWFRRTVQSGFSGLDLDHPEEQLLHGRATVADLNAVKQRCKNALPRAEDRQSRLAVTLAYFLVLAAAIAHHGTLITSQTKDELTPVLWRLSRSTPRPWSGLFEEAVKVLPSV